jgi:hypothetical protein
MHKGCCHAYRIDLRLDGLMHCAPCRLGGGRNFVLLVRTHGKSFHQPASRSRDAVADAILLLAPELTLTGPLTLINLLVI